MYISSAFTRNVLQKLEIVIFFSLIIMIIIIIMTHLFFPSVYLFSARVHQRNIWECEMKAGQPLRLLVCLAGGSMYPAGPNE